MTAPRKPIQVYVIDDEVSLQRALRRLLMAANFEASTFASVDEFLAASVKNDSACIVADVHTEGKSSLDLPLDLEKRGLDIPVIFITAFDTHKTREQVKQIGAAGYFRKPVDDQALIDAIHWAVEKGRQAKH